MSVDMRPPCHRYDLFGVSADCGYELDLPRSRRSGQVEIIFGHVAEEGDLIFGTEDPLPFACYEDQEAIILTWPTTRMRITPHRVVIDTVDAEDALQLLIPAAWSVVLAANERESLHSSVVECNGQALAIMGTSGSGKTTAAQRLIEHGWKLLSDDLLTFDENLRAIPGPPWMRLVLPEDAGPRFVPDAGGKLRAFPPRCNRPTPLSAIIIMDPEYCDLERLSGTAAVYAVLQQVYNAVITHSGQTQRRFELAHDLVGHVPVYGAPPRSLSVDILLELARRESLELWHP